MRLAVFFVAQLLHDLVTDLGMLLNREARLAGRQYGSKTDLVQPKRTFRLASENPKSTIDGATTWKEG